MTRGALAELRAPAKRAAGPMAPATISEAQARGLQWSRAQSSRPLRRALRTRDG